MKLFRYLVSGYTFALLALLVFLPHGLQVLHLTTCPRSITQCSIFLEGSDGAIT